MGTVAKIGQLAAEPVLMGVRDAAQHQFAAGVNDLNIQSGHSLADRLRSIAIEKMSK
jgi:hypothetical protein